MAKFKLLDSSVPTHKTAKTKIVEFADCVDPEEAAHYEPPHIDLYCLLSYLRIHNMIRLGQNTFLNFADEILSFLL